MFQNLCDKINACLERAEQCREAAASEVDERVRQQLLELEQQWQQVAESYQYVESLERLLLDQRPLPPEVEMLPKESPQNKASSFEVLGLLYAMIYSLEAAEDDRGSEQTDIERPR